jgi:hypothetical protein
MAKPSLIIVGADKGGVGKTMVSRALLDYLKANGFEHRAFDTEIAAAPTGVLKRFYPERTEIVDLAEIDGQMRVIDTLGNAVTVIDIRAGLLTPTLETLGAIGFLDPARLNIVVLHVLGNTQTSIDEVPTVADKMHGLRHILVGNRVNNTKFTFPAGALEVPMLVTQAVEALDTASASFASFVNSEASPVLRGYVKTWLGKVHAQFEAAKLI